MIGALILFTQLTAAEPRMTIEDMISVRTLGRPYGGEVVISPDGSHVGYVVHSPVIEKNRVETELWVASADDSSQPIRVASFPAGLAAVAVRPQWTPLRQRLSYLCPGRNGNLLCVAEVSGSVLGIDTVQTNSDVTFSSDYQWSPDERLIAFTASRRVKTPDDTSEAIVVRHLMPWTINPSPMVGSSIYVYDVSRRTITTAMPDSLSASGGFSWSPDSRAIAFSAVPARQLAEWALSRLRDLWIVSLSDGRVRPLVGQPGVDERPVWSPDGQWIAFLSQGGVMDMTWRRWLAIIRSNGSLLSQLGEPFEEATGSVPRNVAWSAKSDTLFFEAEYHLTHQFFALARTGGPARRLTGDDTTVFWATSLSKARDRIAYVASSATVPGDVHVARLRRTVTETRRLTDLNPQLRRLSIASPVRLFRWRNERDSVGLEGGLILPPDVRTGLRYPLVVYLEGGPQMVVLDYNISGAWPYPLLPLASHGYVVFAPNTRGRSGVSRAFMALQRQPGGVGTSAIGDMMSGVDSLIRAGIVDSSRMAIVGMSYGAYLTALTVGKTSRFKAASRANMFVDVVHFLYQTEGDSAQAKLAREMMGWGSPWNAADMRFLREESPIEHASSMRTPLLVEAGVNDPLTHDAWTLHSALLANNVPHALVIYRRVGHGIWEEHEPQGRMEIARRNLDWLEYWLNGRPAPWIDEALKH
jgi:dipeptidyl aminopeptidase/acylaminoacyl peptidase